MPSTLTTADIAAFAALRLYLLRDAADVQHQAALRMVGSLDALQCARRISCGLDECNEVRLLAALAEAHADDAAAAAIRADISATADRLIAQASEARMASIPKLPKEDTK